MADISAQVSLCPLRQEHLSAAIEAAWEAFHRHGLDVQPGTMSTQLTGDDQSVFLALNEALCRAAEHGEVAFVAIVSNACPGRIKQEPIP